MVHEGCCSSRYVPVSGHQFLKLNQVPSCWIQFLCSMSRCFPFSPSLYERKLKIEDGNLQAKEKDKNKEKKHKRDTDKEKKEDKESGKEKHREKDKEKKEKRKDDIKDNKKEKRKHRDKVKKKKKSRSWDEKTYGGGSSNAERIGSNSPQSNQFTGSSSAQELGQRISYVNGATGNQFMGSSSAQVLGQRISYVDGATGNQIVDKANDRNQGGGELLENVDEGNGGYWSAAKPSFGQVASGQNDNNQTRFPKVAIVCNINEGDQRTDIGRTMETQIDKSVDGKRLKCHINKKGEKNKDKDGKRPGGRAENREEFGFAGVKIDLPKDIAFMQEHGRRIRDDNGAAGSQVTAKANATTQKRTEFIGKSAIGGNGGYYSQTKETSNFGNSIHGKDDGQRENNESRGAKVSVVHSFEGVEQRGLEMVRPADTGKKVPIEGTGRNGFNRIGVTARVIDHNEKKSKSKNVEKNKARTDEKAKQGGDNIIKISRLGGSGSDSIDSSNTSKQHALTACHKAPEGFGGKRKEPEANGFLYDHEMQPNKLPRIVPSPQLATESDRKFQLQRSTTITFSTSKQGITNGINLDSKEPMVNGFLGAQRSPRVSAMPSTGAKPTMAMVDSMKPPLRAAKTDVPAVGSTKPPFAAAKTNVPIADSSKPPSSAAKVNVPMIPQESVLSTAKPSSVSMISNGTVGTQGSPLGSMKRSSSKSKHKDRFSSKPPPPHPDTKYLSLILSIPKMDEWSELNDEEWLFENSFPSKEDTKMGSLTDDGQHQVWAKVVHIEPADLYALPYVIPY